MDDRVKNWILGFIFGGAQIPTRDRTPIDIPVSMIQIGYETDTMQINGGNQLLTAYVYPTNATNQKLEWSSSDETVAVVIANENSTSAIVQPIGIGDCIIKVKATDSSNKEATLNIHVIAGLTFETLEFKSTSNINYLKYNWGFLVILNYTPVKQKGELIKLDINESITKNESQYIVEDTFFDNIKLVKLKMDSSNDDDYYSTTNGNIGYNIYTVDGSGLSLPNRTLSIDNELVNAMYGLSNTVLNNTYNKDISVGLPVSMFWWERNTREQSIFNLNGGLSEVNIIDGADLIELGPRNTIIGHTPGTARIEIITNNKYKVTFNYNIKQNTGTGEPRIDLYDQNGNIIDKTNGIVLNGGQRIYAVATSKGATISKITPDNTDDATVNNDGSVTVTKPGYITFKVDYQYERSGVLTEATTSVGLRVYTDVIQCGTATSAFLKDGMCIWCSGKNIYPFGGYSFQDIDIIVNAKDIQILDELITTIGSIKGTNPWEVQLTTQGINKQSLNTRQFIRLYHINKLTSSQTTVRFQLRDFPDIYDEMII